MHLEEGNLIFRSVFSLDAAISTHKRLYCSFNSISRHALSLAQIFTLPTDLSNGNMGKICPIYALEGCTSLVIQGAMVTFDMQRADRSQIKAFKIPPGMLANSTARICLR